MRYKPWIKMKYATSHDHKFYRKMTTIPLFNDNQKYLCRIIRFNMFSVPLCFVYYGYSTLLNISIQKHF